MNQELDDKVNPQKEWNNVQTVFLALILGLLAILGLLQWELRDQPNRVRDGVVREMEKRYHDKFQVEAVSVKAMPEWDEYVITLHSKQYPRVSFDVNYLKGKREWPSFAGIIEVYPQKAWDWRWRTLVRQQVTELYGREGGYLFIGQFKTQPDENEPTPEDYLTRPLSGLGPRTTAWIEYYVFVDEMNEAAEANRAYQMLACTVLQNQVKNYRCSVTYLKPECRKRVVRDRERALKLKSMYRIQYGQLKQEGMLWSRVNLRSDGQPVMTVDVVQEKIHEMAQPGYWAKRLGDSPKD
ncbi:MAG: hypothetical protein ACM3QZ_00905 [Solirubrobacterales bacterium]